MGRAARGAGSLTRVALKAAATNGALDAHRSRALCTYFSFPLLSFSLRETGAHADSDCLVRLMSGLRLCTLRCGGRAQLLSHRRRRHTRELQRCTRVDLTRVDSIRQIPATLVWTSPRTAVAQAAMPLRARRDSACAIAQAVDRRYRPMNSELWQLIPDRWLLAHLHAAPSRATSHGQGEWSRTARISGGRYCVGRLSD